MYTFNFTTVSGGPAGTTSLPVTTPYALMSTPSLALHYGGVYDVTVDVLYNLQNSAGTPEPVSMTGTIVYRIGIMAQTLLEISSNKRCVNNITLPRTATLTLSPVVAGSSPCAITGYTWEFQQVATLDCVTATPFGSVTTYNTV